MITSEMARKAAMEMAQDQAWYAPINMDRMLMKRQYFQVNDYVCFEYWNKLEWEFTLGLPVDDDRREAYYAILVAMGAYMHTINVSLSRLPALLAQCRAKLTAIDKAFAERVIA